jgi:hypothetical protein
MLTVVCWLWRQESRTVLYKPEYVDVWANMLRRNLTIPHRLLCITDNPSDIKTVETYPLWEDLGVNNPKWGHTRPQCYRRLKAFSEEMRPILGDRFVSMDLDCVILGNIDAILSRPEEFIINRGTTQKNPYNGSLWMMNTGCRSFVWDTFDPETSPKQAERWLGSDQAWMREALGPNEATWGIEDGITNYLHVARIPRWNPKDTKIVFFQGTVKPWDSTALQRRWIKDNWR